MLNGEQNNSRSGGERSADQVNRKEKDGTERPAHQHPYADQDDVVPEHMPVLFARFPIASFKTRGMRLNRQVRLRNLPSNNTTHQADTAFEPGKARVHDHIYKAGKWSDRDAALASVHALLGIG